MYSTKLQKCINYYDNLAGKRSRIFVRSSQCKRRHKSEAKSSIYDGILLVTEEAQFQHGCKKD